MRHLSAIVMLMVMPMVASAGEPVPSVQAAIDRGLAYMAKSGLAWKETKRCASCHHVPLSIWALNEAKNRGFAINDKALDDLSAWVVSPDDPGKLYAKEPPPKHVNVNEAPLLLALGVEAGNIKAMQDGLKKMLTTLLGDQCDDGSWKLSHQSRPIGSSPEVLTTLALLALSSPNAPELGEEGKTAREKGLQWLRSASADDEPQAAALRLILWRRLGLPEKEWEPLVTRLRSAQNADGGWGQTKQAKSDAYATGQVLCALAEAGAKAGDEAVQKAQSFLAKTQGPDGAWPMISRAILPSGKPPKDMEPITHAASAWAVMGLVRSSAVVTKSGTAAAR